MKYRKEIDGLRAFAVIPVILFHAGFSQFSGGFVGVDVFFVISGYLITTIILSEKETGTFSLAHFYERRARRIIPALFLVLLVSTLLSWLWLTPSHMQDFSKSLVAVSLFSSNILFWLETGYWGVENELKPLLHTWSLAVEEQYYLLFPLFLMMMWRFRKRWILGSFFVVAIASLLLAQWAAYNLPTANFYLLPTRGWELAIGAGIAFYFLYRKNVIRSLLSHKLVDELFGFLGLVLIAYAVFVFDENTPFPSVYALVPTIGTALVILFSSKETFAGKLLSSKVFVGIGLVSYSAYLWHQPLFAFARHGSLQEPSEILLLALSIASLLLAFFSWKYVEAPFRKNGLFSRKQIFLFTVIGSAFFMAFGLIGNLTGGYPNRIDDKVRDSVSAAKTKKFGTHLCGNLTENGKLDGDHCVLVGGKKSSAFLYGDSHAKTLTHQAQRAFAKTELGLLYSNNTGCPPVENVHRLDSGFEKSCVKRTRRIYNYIRKSPNIEYVVLSARWALWVEGSLFDNREGGSELGSLLRLETNGKELSFGDNESADHELVAGILTNTISDLLDAGKKVILIYPIPEAGWDVPDYISRYYMSDPDSVFDESTASTSYEVFRKRNERAIAALDKVDDHENLIRVFPEQLFCDNDVPERCITQKDGVIFYKDDDHLSDEGASLIVEEMMKQIQGPSQF